MGFIISNNNIYHEGNTDSDSLFSFILNLFSYLNSAGVYTDSDMIEDFFRLANAGSLPVISENKITSILIPLIAKNPDDYARITVLIKNYIEKIKNKKSEEEKKNEKIRQFTNESETAKKEMLEKYEKINKNIEKIKNEIKEKEKENFADRERKRKIEKIKKKYEEYVKPVEKDISGLADTGSPVLRLHDIINSNASFYTENEINKIKKDITYMAKAAIKEKNKKDILKGLNAISTIAPVLTHPEKSSVSFLETKLTIAEKNKEETKTKIENLSSELEKRIKDYLKNKEEENKKREERIIKDSVKKHREEFMGGTRGVVNTGSGDVRLEKTFNSMTADEKAAIYDYIRQNVRKFRTKMAKKIKGSSHARLDIVSTVKKSCAFGGIPIRLIYEKPKKSKTKLALFLDVSGSCKKASELMMVFAYYLREIFPGGCLVYAFVNNVYDISYIMKENDVENVTKTALEMIPRSGVYSDYNKAFSDVCSVYFPKLTKDTICIFIGDARNNKNPSGIEYLKKIVRKCKASYWLNTDEVTKWNQGDSIISEYMPYMKKTYEVLTPSDLIKFIEKM